MELLTTMAAEAVKNIKGYYGYSTHETTVDGKDVVARAVVHSDMRIARKRKPRIDWYVNNKRVSRASVEKLEFWK